MTEYIGLIRGINVGRARRLAMSQLRELVEGLGHTHVRTLLNSGNVVFEAARSRVNARAIEEAITNKFGFSARVVVVSAAEIATIVAENPLHGVATDPSKHMVAFVASPATLIKARPLLKSAWAPEAFGIGRLAAYLWCANGVIESKLAKAFGLLVGEAATIRNWSTVQKLFAATSQKLDNSVDDYIAAFPPAVRTILEKIRATIKKAAPDAEEKISYQMPTFTLAGNLVYFGAFKNHVGFYPPVRGDKELERQASAYAGEKGNLRFPLDQPIPYTLITKIVKARVTQNLERADARKKKRQKPRTAAQLKR